ncbi:hypothetical protein GARC_3561 [Paraglaciecola arctica BSs20135]|uniref:Uncharacterized protein n=1 Tax=Paraglaciecola arctica BSs20135 TaxID=493475 RepID=K6ZAP9_9ALTE|nr:hypothetical protein GARC_3561 [Paraglaciecola arctica BSs20135]
MYFAVLLGFKQFAFIRISITTQLNCYALSEMDGYSSIMMNI